MGRELTIGARVLDLFAVLPGEAPKELSLGKIQALLAGEEETSVKTAIQRLRGKGSAAKKLRAVRYISQAGHGGTAQPVLALGDGEDAPRAEGYVETDDERLARVRKLRSQQEDMRVKRELAAIDNYM